MNAFYDILRDGGGTPDEGFILRWKNAERPHRRLCRCQEPQVEPSFAQLVALIREHGPGGDSSDCNVHLELI